MNDLIACTIISKNYLSYARVFTRSFLEHHPESKVFVLLVDRVDGCFDVSKEPFVLITIDDLCIPDAESFTFKYNILELNTAVKPFFLSYLLRQLNLQKIIYFDPDILVFQNLEKISELLNQYSIILTPHITEPIEDFSLKPNEIEIMLRGSYNLGFIAISKCETVEKFLFWWGKRLARFCLSRPNSPLFVDQKWIDLVPGLFKDVFILTDPGYNVAYWNLSTRKLIKDGSGKYCVNGQPVFFFHFSGFSPQHPEVLSKHQTRVHFSDQNCLRELFDTFCQLQFQNGYDQVKQWPYAFGFFDNGIPIPDFVRRLYYSLAEKGLKFENPFQTREEKSFLSWLNAPKKNRFEKGYISNLHYEIYRSSQKLISLFPNIWGKYFLNYARWLMYKGKTAYNLHSSFLNSLQPLFGNKFARRIVWVRKVSAILKFRKTFKPYVELMKMLRRVLGEDCFFRIRAFLTGKSFPILNKETSLLQSDRSFLSVESIGLNIAGYITAESGVAEGVRSMILAVKTAMIPYVLNNHETNPSRKNDLTYVNELKEENPYDVNLIQMNADRVSYFHKSMSPFYFRDKYNIGFWAWELSSFPKEWHDRFRYFNEIWTYSNFSLEALSKVSPIPVIRMMPSIEVKLSRLFSRQYFHLAENQFLFFFMFDFYGVFERKNPLAVVEAFKKAFSPKDSVGLILKFTNASFNPVDSKRLHDAVEGYPIQLIDGYLSRDEVYGLLTCSDAYISLHRSEGFGLTMAEAMYLGKPTIATGYSSNIDFMNASNSYLVKFRLKEIEQDYGPYKKGNVWAEPDTDDAARWMRYVYDRREAAQLVAQQGAEDIRSWLSPKVVGQQIKERLERVIEISS